MNANEVSKVIIDAAMAIHKKLGPGLLESSYEACMIYEIRKRGLKVESQKALPLEYGEVKIDAGYRIDLLVEDAVIVELKTADAIAPIHEAQLLTYLRLSGKTIGLIINFNVIKLKNGIKRMVNQFNDEIEK